MKKANFFSPIIAGVATLFVSGIASAVQQDVYVADSSSNQVAIIAPNGTTTTIGSPLLNGPTGVAFDSQGNLFIANNGGDIVEYNTTSDLFSVFATGLNNPRGLAFDSQGNLYVANQSSGIISEFSNASVLAGSGTPTTYTTGLNTPNGIAIDTFGDLYVALGANANAIARIDPGGAVVTTFDTTGVGLNGPNGIVFGPNGDLYVVNHNNPSVEQISLLLAGSTFISSNPINGLNGAKTLGFDANGDLYVTDYGNNTVTEYNASGMLIHTYSTDISGPCFLTFSPTSSNVTVPEPGTYAMLLAGLGLLYFYQRRRMALANA